MPRHEAYTCPECSYRMDACFCVEDEPRVPKPGDLGICGNCGLLLVFEAVAKVRALTPEWRANYERNHPEFIESALLAQGLVRLRGRFM